jgi:putative ABC transport system permease protein
VEIPGSETDGQMLRFNGVGARYFRTLGLPVLAGREFHEGDSGVVLNQAAVRRLSLADPIERELRIMGVVNEVVGVVADSRIDGLRGAPVPMMYLPFEPDAMMTLLVRSVAAGSATLEAALRASVAETDPDAPVVRVQPLSSSVAAILRPQRMASLLIGCLGLIGLALAALGIYGVLSYDVAQRRREIGVRIALGAGAAGVARQVAVRATTLVLIGAALGIVGGIGVARILETLLLGVSPIDPLALGGVLALLLTVGLLASYLPARRAARVDPMIALRAE